MYRTSAEIREQRVFVLTVRMFKRPETWHFSISLLHAKRVCANIYTFFLILMSALEPNMLFNLTQLCVNRFVWNHNCDRAQMWICGLGRFSWSINELERHLYDSLEHSDFIRLKARRGSEGLTGIRLPALTQTISAWEMCWNGCKEDEKNENEMISWLFCNKLLGKHLQNDKQRSTTEARRITGHSYLCRKTLSFTQTWWS